MNDSPDDTKGEIPTVNATFTEGVDFYFENGLMVLTRGFLLSRGNCCKTGCRHCPYEIESNKLSE
jgi:hypothetical protein